MPITKRMEAATMIRLMKSSASSMPSLKSGS